MESKKEPLLNLLKRQEAQAGIALLVIMILLTLTVYNDVPAFQERWLPCLEDLGKGEIYQGQPRCVQGPVFFITAFGMQKIFRGFFDSAIISTSIILHLITFFLIIFIAKKALPKFSAWITAALYIFFVFIPASNYLAAFYSSIFFIIGFMLLFFVKPKHHLIISGISFAISLLNNANSIIPIAISVLVWLIQDINWKEKPFSSLVEKSKSAVFILSPIFALIVIFELLLPGALAYQFFVLGLHEQGSFISSLSQSFHYLAVPTINREMMSFVPGALGFLASIDPLWVISISMIVMGLLALLVNRKKQTTQVFLISMILMLPLNIKLGGGDIIRHILPLNILLVIITLEIYSVVKEKAGKKQRVFLFLTLILCLSLAFAFYNHSPHPDNKALNSLSEKIHYPITFIPWVNYTVLTDTDLSQLGIPKEKQIIFPTPVSEKETIDSTQAERLELLGLLKEPWINWRNKDYERYPEVISGMFEGKYDALAFGTTKGNSPLFNTLLSTNNETSKSGYILFMSSDITCEINLLTVINHCPTCQHSLDIYLRNENSCQAIKDRIADYYSRNFNELCKEDSFLLTWFARHTNFMSSAKCQSGKSITMSFYSNGFIISYIQMAVFIALLAFIIIYSWRGGNAKK